MAAPDFSAPYPYIAMPTGQGPQGADVPGPWPPVTSPIHQRSRWEHDPDRAFGYQADGFFLPPPFQYGNSPYHQQNYQPSPYTSFSGQGWPTMHMYPTSPFHMSSHQPRPPPAIRSGHVDALMNSSVAGHDMYREASTNYGALYRGPRRNDAWPIPPQPSGLPGNTSSTSFEGSPSVQATSNSHLEHGSPQTDPLHPRPSGPTQAPRQDQYQRNHADRTAQTHHIEHAEPRTPRVSAAQARRPDRSSSPRTATRRRYNRYSADISPPSTSSNLDEGAARSPPPYRVSPQSREGRLRFFRAVYDPNVTTQSQIESLKANLPKLLLGDLPKDTSPTCDICAKDYSTTHVQPSEEEEVAVKLSCGHSFGEFCINQWFETCKTHKNKVTCPMCRKQLIEPPRSPFTTDRFDSGVFSSSMYMHAARNSQSFRELLANELQAQYARA